MTPLNIPGLRILTNTEHYSSQSGKECSHVWAATREMGTEIYWEDCNFEEMVDHQCNTLDDLPGMNCKLFASEKGAEI